MRFVVEFVSQAQIGMISRTYLTMLGNQSTRANDKIVVENEKVSLSPYVIDDLLPKLDVADRNVRTRVR
jgi:hypothetical protein